MKITVLGPGCAKCKKLLAEAEKAARECGVSAVVDKVEDIAEIVSRGVMMTPALIIDDEVKCSGRLAYSKEICGWIRQRLG